MDFALPPETEALRRRIADFVAAEIMPLEADRANYDEHENIALPVLEALRAKVKAAGLWAPQMPRELGGLGLNVSGHGGLLRGHGAFDLRSRRLQLRRTGRRQHDRAGPARHAGAEAALAHAHRRGTRALGLRHDRAHAGRRLRSLGHAAPAR